MPQSPLEDIHTLTPIHASLSLSQDGMPLRIQGVRLINTGLCERWLTNKDNL